MEGTILLAEVLLRTNRGSGQTTNPPPHTQKATPSQLYLLFYQVQCDSGHQTHAFLHAKPAEKGKKVNRTPEWMFNKKLQQSCRKAEIRGVGTGRVKN